MSMELYVTALYLSNFVLMYLSCSVLYISNLVLILLLLIMFLRRSSQDDLIDNIFMPFLFNVTELSLTWNVKGCSCFSDFCQISHIYL